MEIYEVSTEYVKYLKKYQKHVMSNFDNKASRKFIGIFVKKGKYNYVVPFSSPKYLKDYSIKNYSGDNLPADFSYGKYKKRIIMLRNTTEPVVYMYTNNSEGTDLFGKIVCNNMIPVPDCELKKIDIDSETDEAYKNLLQKQINFVRKNAEQLLKKHINPVYNNRINNRTNIGYIRKATLDFALLEAKHDEWINTKQT